MAKEEKDEALSQAVAAVRPPADRMSGLAVDFGLLGPRRDPLHNAYLAASRRV
jgi:hypothetical protein